MTIKRQTSRRKGGLVSLVATLSAKSWGALEELFSRKDLEEWIKSRNGERPEALTLKRVGVILKGVLRIADRHPWLIAFGFMTSMARATMTIWYDWPMKYITEAVDHNVLNQATFWPCIMHFVFLWIVCRWTVDRFLTPIHDSIRVATESYGKGEITLEVIDGVKNDETPAEKNLQSSAQSSREVLPSILLAMMSDIPKILVAIGFFCFFIYLAVEAPVFSAVAITGLLISCVVANLTRKLSDRFTFKQGALDHLQDVENEVHDEIYRSKAEVLFIFKNWVWSGSQVNVVRLQEAVDQYVRASIKAGILLVLNGHLREFCFDFTRMLSVAVVAWYFSLGTMEFGMLFVLNGYIERTAEAIGLASNLQQLILNGQYFADWYMKVTTPNEEAQ
ncbi:hypothetical protein HYT05_02070 [Candidatus Kaiserbacteria bacterium]|nr:hypothetical protein [Candidatus Kaiserbacteria bacterium]